MKQLKSKQIILEELKNTIESTINMLEKVSRSPKRKPVHVLRTLFKRLKAYTSFFLHMKCDTSVVQEGMSSLQDIYGLTGNLRTLQLARQKKKADKLLLQSQYKPYKKVLKKQKKIAVKKLSRGIKDYSPQMLRDWYDALYKLLQPLPITNLTYHRKTYKPKCMENITRLVNIASPSDDDLHDVRKYLKRFMTLADILEQSPDPALKKWKALAEYIGNFHDIVEHINLLEHIMKYHAIKTVSIGILEEMKESIKTSLTTELRNEKFTL